MDTIGSGIKRMFSTQKTRFMPMPDYELSVTDEVKVRLSGRILDENYTKLLIKQADLTLDQVILLDKVQKHIKISKEAHQKLKTQGIVEGRFPNLHVSSKIAGIIGSQVQYIKNRAFDNEHYKKLIYTYLEKYNSAKRKDISDLLMDKLPDILNEKQKVSKIKNLLYEMAKKDKIIKTEGSTLGAVWVLAKN